MGDDLLRVDGMNRWRPPIRAFVKLCSAVIAAERVPMFDLRQQAVSCRRDDQVIAMGLNAWEVMYKELKNRSRLGERAPIDLPKGAGVCGCLDDDPVAEISFFKSMKLFHTRAPDTAKRD